MKKSRLLLMVGVLAVASCEKSPPVPDAGPAAAPVAPSGPAVAGAQKRVIKPGKYRVCQDAGESGHGAVVGPHLLVDQTVEIKPFGANGATKVCFKKECPPAGSNPPESEVKVMWLAGDENKLSGEGSFDHNKNGQTEKLSHFVQIFDDPDDHGDAELCTKPNVLTINFCTPDESSDELNCVGGTGPHLGHVHGEN